MRSGLISNYATHALVPTPDVAGKVIIYKLSTDGLVYVKDSTGASTSVAHSLGEVSIGASFDASGVLPQYPATTKGTLIPISVGGTVGGTVATPGQTVVAGDCLLAIVDSVGGDTATAGADFVILTGYDNITAVAVQAAAAQADATQALADSATAQGDASAALANSLTNAAYIDRGQGGYDIQNDGNSGAPGEPLSLFKRLSIVNTDSFVGANGLFSLADGTLGQKVIILLKTKGGAIDAVITPANFFNGTNITLSADGQFVELIFLDTNWYVLSTTGAVA